MPKHIDEFLITAWIAACLMVIGYQTGVRRTKSEAVANGVAYYSADPSNGILHFNWVSTITTRLPERIQK